ncbi:hypothetical protein OG948_45865 (plasmid) [Embleya sp. NBC_00888]|uniref:hypothetical protein n=1 Tax=Embleya sp. NBC_00888 TaxID=2975960 RepID=UPI002F9160B9|nr:hypothetical protein OG948_45865 [Embleya sp. NBC_00888]
MQAHHLGHRAHALAPVGDRTGAIRALVRSLCHRPRGECRARAVTTARLAEPHLDQGHLERGRATWQAFPDYGPLPRSGRADAALRALRRRLAPYRGNATARTPLERPGSAQIRPRPAFADRRPQARPST